MYMCDNVKFCDLKLLNRYLEWKGYLDNLFYHTYYRDAQAIVYYNFPKEICKLFAKIEEDTDALLFISIRIKCLTSGSGAGNLASRYNFSQDSLTPFL